MIRKKQILNAAREYNEGVTLSSPSNVLHFEAGANWADEHPKNIWHSASEEPKNDSHILMQYNYFGDKEYKSFHNEYDEFINWEKLVKIHGISQWAYISDLLPKGGEK